MKTEKKVIYGWFFFNGRAGKLTNNFFFYLAFNGVTTKREVCLA